MKRPPAASSKLPNIRSSDFVVEPGKKFRLSDHDTSRKLKVKSRAEGEAVLRLSTELLQGMQDRLYAQDRWAVLLIFQAMDAAGKDGTIKHVMSGLNPQGCQVFSFKAPSDEELDHDYLWRTNRCLPERGRIGVFNRSYYEEVLVVRVHREILKGQKLPPSLVGKKIWKQRFDDINAWERYLTRNGIVIRKFFLHLSKEEQKRRFLKRLEDPKKNWKFSARDVEERARWDDYMEAYEDALRHTSTEHAPWYVIPADFKWFTRVATSMVVAETLEGLKLEYPKVSTRQRLELEAARKGLLEE